MNFKSTATLLIAASLLATVAAGANAKTLVVQLKGKGEFVEPEDTPMPELLEGRDLMACFKVDMFDPRRGRKIGIGFDCLSEVEVDEENGDVSVTDTAFFVFRRGFRRGVLASVERVEARPADLGANGGDSGVGQGRTHVTGSFPDEDTIVAGTGWFRNVTGSVRLSGGVDMSGINNTIPELDFDCLFVIDYEYDNRYGYDNFFD